MTQSVVEAEVSFWRLGLELTSFHVVVGQQQHIEMNIQRFKLKHLAI